MLRGIPLSILLSLMLKRRASGNRSTRRKKKGNVAYSFSSLDPSDDENTVVENVRIWDISASEKTGRMTATRRTLKHHSGVLPPGEPSTSQRVEKVAGVEDSAFLADSETPLKAAGNHRPKRKRIRVVKENDSASELLASLLT